MQTHKKKQNGRLGNGSTISKTDKSIQTNLSDHSKQRVADTVLL